MNNGQTLWEEPVEISDSRNPTIMSSSSMTAANMNTRQKLTTDVVASWRELTAASGRKYYYNAVTKVSMWEIPPEYAEYLERIKDPSRVDKEVLEEKFMAMLKEKVKIIICDFLLFYRTLHQNLVGKKL